MNYCLIHQQMYPLGAVCPYCGPAMTITSATCGSRGPCADATGTADDQISAPVVEAIRKHIEASGMAPDEFAAKMSEFQQTENALMDQVERDEEVLASQRSEIAKLCSQVSTLTISLGRAEGRVEELERQLAEARKFVDWAQANPFNTWRLYQRLSEMAGIEERVKALDAARTEAAHAD